MDGRAEGRGRIKEDGRKEGRRAGEKKLFSLLVFVCLFVQFLFLSF